MATFQCNACRLRFTDPDDAGAPFFHVCPPLVIYTVVRGGVQMEIDPWQIEPSDDHVDTHTHDREGHVDLHLAADGPNQGFPISPGWGVVQVSPTEPPAAT